MIPFALLGLAILIEVASTTLLPRTDSFRNLPVSAVVLTGYGLSIYLLALVVRSIPTYIAYTVWAGVGTALVAVIAMAFRGEPVSPARVVGVGLVVGGVVLLNLHGADH